MHPGRHHVPARGSGLILAAVLILWALPAAALVSFDFETPYLVHPTRQVWDFCLVPHGGQYHVFYHTVPQQDLHAANADTIWHAVSADLRRWRILGPVLTSGPEWWDEVAIWAPDVVYDDQTGRWAMLYTGIAQGMVQRACLAWSDDLETWVKSPANPVFEPDSATYFWSPSEAWSSFRDPFIFHDGQTWNMLSTAHLRIGGVPGYRRGIVHRAVSTDLENWQDAGVFYEHDGTSGRSNALESVQYVVRAGRHHLFFTEQDPALEHHPTSHMTAADPSGWTMAGRTIVDAGWAPEIEPFAGNGGADVFARLAKGQDPRDGTWFVTAKFDSIRFDPGGSAPVVVPVDPLGPDWPTRTGPVGAAAPTFGDNPALRGDPAMGAAGHGWFGSAENYGGPLGGTGLPGATLGETATGGLESAPFIVSTGWFRLLLGGGNYPATCYVGLVDDASGALLTSISPEGTSVLAPRIWDAAAFSGVTVRMVIVDEETGPEGWIAADAIEEFAGASAVDDGGRGLDEVRVRNLTASPNPFNARTEIGFEIPGDGMGRLEIFDLAGRRVWRSPGFTAGAGNLRLVWNGCDGSGRHLPSGAYHVRVIHRGVPVAGLRLTLLK
jgi:hypothetical protein